VIQLREVRDHQYVCSTMPAYIVIDKSLAYPVTVYVTRLSTHV